MTGDAFIERIRGGRSHEQRALSRERTIAKMSRSARHGNSRVWYCLYVLVATLVVDGAMAAIFWERLATNKDYFTLGVRRRDPRFHHSYESNIRARARWGGTVYPLATNSLGLLDSRNRDVKRNPDGRRIVFLGDSFTEGLGFPFEKTFVGIIGRRLRGEDTEVLNAAVASYSPKLYYLKMKYLAESLKLRCDRVVVFLDMSDAQDEVAYKKFVPRDKDSGWSLARRLRGYAIRHSVIGNFADRVAGSLLKSRTGFNDAVEEEMDRIEKSYVNYEDFLYERSGWYSERNFGPWGREGAALARHYMAELVSLCRSHNIAVTLAVYPWPRQAVENIPENPHVLFWKRFALEQNVDFVNFFPLFMPEDSEGLLDQYYLPSDIHFNEAGHALIAAEFLKFKSARGL